MTYQTVFEATEQGYVEWWQAAVGLTLVFVGVALLFRVSGNIARWFYAFIALIWVAIMFARTDTEYREAGVALREGRYHVVEGPVTDFESGLKRESFSVQGQRFSYSDGVMIPGFHQTARSGGPIHEGLRVRIAYAGDMILRLEVAP